MLYSQRIYSSSFRYDKEIPHYDYNNHGFKSGTGHFTQVVWKTTTKVGCAVAYAADGKSTFVVAKYEKPGNYFGQFAANVMPLKSS